MSSLIHILDQSTIDKIAAGEVVERPASVVKELVENSLDAGATRITIEIQGGGISLLRVTDNGCGIASEDLPYAFLRHATSKIEDVKDLNSLTSLGFRGEALSSIAAVSRVEVITKREEDLTASRYLIEGGREKELEEIGAPEGTSVVMRDLFFNTPARGKFLKSAATEAAHVGDIVEQLILSNPEVAFTYIVNGQTKLSSSGSGKLSDAVYHIYGRDLMQLLIPISVSDGVISIEGLIGKPQVSRGNRNFENYYVNGRYVKSRIIMRAIEDGYGTKLMQHQYPFACFKLQIAPDAVDVNVHPTKMDVRFSDEKRVYEFVRAAVEQTLKGLDLTLDAAKVEAVSSSKRGIAQPKESLSEASEAGNNGEKKKAPRPAEPFENFTFSKKNFSNQELSNQDLNNQNLNNQDLNNQNLNNQDLSSQDLNNLNLSNNRDNNNPGNKEENDDAITHGEVISERTEAVITAPETAAPEVTASETTASETTASEITAPELTAPVITRPEISASGKVTPDLTIHQMASQKVGAHSSPTQQDRLAQSHLSLEQSSAEKSDSLEQNHLSSANELHMNAYAGASLIRDDRDSSKPVKPGYVQQTFAPVFLSKEAKPFRRIIGQIFDTYWIAEYGDKVFVFDQHAAHERILFEKFMKQYENRGISSQQLSPPWIVTLEAKEEALLLDYIDAFTELGFEIEHFGERDYAIRAVPYALGNLDSEVLFHELLDQLEVTPHLEDNKRYIRRVATEACKAAVKGGGRLSQKEAEQLLDDLMNCEDPYHCPHGRPTILSFSKQDVEKRFKRIV